MLTAILFIVMILILVIPHELGHLIVAKLCDVQVNEFSVGMGPLLFQKQKGDTLYSFRLFPIGGYCAMEGEDEEKTDNPRSFNNKKPLQKIAILVAGVVMNVLIAILIFTICMMIRTVPTNEIASITPNSPAETAGITSGQRLIQVDNVKSSDWSVLSQAISEYEAGDILELTVAKDGVEHTYFITPEYSEENQRYLIGITMKSTRNPIDCTRYGIRTAWAMNTALLQSFKMLFQGQVSTDDMAGPVGIVKLVDDAKDVGFMNYMLLLGLMSLNLAIINILPFPALDGGRILFVIIRRFTGNAISDNAEAIIHFIGMMALFALIIYLTFNDIMKLF